MIGLVRLPHVLLGLLVVAAGLPLSSSQYLDSSTTILVKSFNITAEELALVPKCAFKCLAGQNKTSTDIAGACRRDEGTLSKAKECLQKVCTVHESLRVASFVSRLCGDPIRDLTTEFKILTLVLGGITGLVVGLRFISKFFYSYRRGFGPDDWSIFAAMVVAIPGMFVNVFGLAANGLGRDVWAMTPEGLANFARYFYIEELVYLTLMTLVKLSLCLFYLEIFPGIKIRRLLWSTVAFHVAMWLAFFIKVIFQCLPLGWYWARFNDLDPYRGKCININAAGWAHAALNVASDIWLLALPLSQLRSLGLHWKRKVGAAIMFSMGTLVTIVSILRIHSLGDFANSTNPTWDQRAIVWWSTVEVNIGIICTCLPSIRLFLGSLFPHVFGTNASTSGTHTSSRGERLGSSNHRTDLDDLELELSPTPPEDKSIIRTLEYTVETNTSDERLTTSMPIEPSALHLRP